MPVIPENRGSWKQFKEHSVINQQHIWKTHQVATENSHIGHCTHNSESINVEKQNLYREK
jgi:hypothetical protein